MAHAANLSQTLSKREVDKAFRFAAGLRPTGGRLAGGQVGGRSGGRAGGWWRTPSPSYAMLDGGDDADGRLKIPHNSFVSQTRKWTDFDTNGTPEVSWPEFPLGN